MDDIMARLDQVPKKFSDGDFLSNKGMSNEVGIYVFQYDPKDEMIVRSYFAGLKAREGMPFRLVECDLYKIFLVLGFLNTKIPKKFIELFNPTLNTYASDICNLPFIETPDKADVISTVEDNKSVAKVDWDSYETSWDFKRSPLV